jgi:hypothetical protein
MRTSPAPNGIVLAIPTQWTQWIETFQALVPDPKSQTVIGSP